MSAVKDLEQERRITFCLYEHWEKLASDGNLPALKNMKRDQIAPFKNNLTLLDLRENVDEPTFQVIGADLLEDLEEDLTHKPVSEVPRRTMLSRIIDHYKEVLANRVPIAFEAEFVNNDGENALYRGILLPFSDDNENINFILGGVRWILEKDLTLDDTKPTIEELMKSIAAGKNDSRQIEDDIAARQSNDPEQMTDPIRQEEEPVSEAEPEELEDELTLAALKSTLKQVIGYINKEDAYHNRSRDSLYNILTAIYEFHATCETSPNAYAELLKEHDLKLQSRAPFTPILKICLGKDYDKTRLTEYAAALGIARFMNIDIDEFLAFIKNFPGGIKGCVKEMRVIRKHGASGNITARKTRSIEEAREILREMAPIASFRLKKVIVGNNIDEFCLLLAKLDGHDISVLKILDNNYAKLDPVLKRAAFIKGNLNNGRK